ncbi:MAG: GNAT family N-acetyltransferase [Armatimonadetes bacterium]|nr:GNAT family N-acetyltransferase [Armatimonadota bacterium]
MSEPSAGAGIVVCPFEFGFWRPLWQVRLAQLAEHGVVLDPEAIPERPAHVGRDGPEWDIHRMEEVYLSGAGGFWLAWAEGVPVGYVGGQDIGNTLELRRMYVRADQRRRGIGTWLVRALVDHGAARGVKTVELWTAGDGPGRALYERLGFQATDGPGAAFRDVAERTGYTPGPDEIRMRLDVPSFQSRRDEGER